MDICTHNRIEFKRGDDDALIVGLKDAIFQTGDKVFFSVKANKGDETDIFQIESTTIVSYLDVEDAGIQITIPHESTIDLPLDKYYYDILIEWADGTFVTVIEPTRFNLVAGASHPEVDPEES